MTANKVFLDATALIALAMPRDQHHLSASALMEEATDCISFVVMRERGITEALTADEHFEQAGFVPLLKG